MKRLEASRRLPVLLLLTAICLSELGAVWSLSSKLMMSNVEHPKKTTVFQRAFPNSKQSQDDQVEQPSNSNNENKDGDMLMLAQQQQVAYQGAIISVRGSLAFWRPTAPNTATSGADESPLVSSLASQYFSAGSKRGQPGRGGTPGVGRLPAAAAGQLVKCPPLSAFSNRRSNLFEPASSSAAADAMPLANAARWPEVLAVEGTTIKLNLVIVAHRPQLGRQFGQDKQLYGDGGGAGAAANIFRWTQNNQVVVYDTPRSRIQQQQLLLLSENDIVVGNHHLSSQPIAARFFAFQNSSSSSSGSDLLFSSSDGHFAGSQAQTTSTTSNSSLDSFMLAPHLNEPLISRLEASKALETRLASAIQAVGNQARRGSQSLGLVDDFLAGGQSIDWQKLEAYLRFDANSLRLDQLTGGGQNAEPSSAKEDTQRSSEGGCVKLALEQFSVIQVELSHLLAHSDGGLYQLQVCPQQQHAERNHQFSEASINQTEAELNCQLVVGFQLHVVQDIPHLESKSERIILEPGDQLSIKCEATGFTLPQITWFLDNQQLNEHQQQLLGSGQTGHSLSTLSIEPSVSSNLFKIRIGDYVSQDNHVHSFVNTSSVQVTDGGFYKCQANNGFHTVELESRVEVRGPPIIARRLSNMNVLVGQNQLHIQCPYSGFPISGVEWYYRPSIAGAASTGRQQRAKRWPLEAQANLDRAGLFEKPFANEPESYLDADKDPDPDKDEWLSQANSMTTATNSDDYPDPLPDYPSNLDYEGARSDLVPPSELVAELEVPDYSDLETDFQQQQQQQSISRRRRKRDSGEPQDWVKFPQSRRHQIHLNGTLILHDVARSDQGFYRCRVLQAAKLQGSHQTSLYSSLLGHLDGAGQLEDLAADSNDFHLTVLVPPVISPFASTESLREGMRNFLTCSVIEGDPPVRLHWLKDNLPIEEHLQQQSSDWSGGRIRVETSNEYTSTLYFSQVDFNDSGNYTCMATNKAASVNYTARMLVNVPPKWVNAPKDVECVAGQSIVIDCQARAHPNPRVWWEIGLYSSREDPIQAANGSVANGNNNNNKQDQIASAASNALAGQHNLQQQSLQATANALQPPNHYRTIISNSRIHILENASLVIRDVHRLDQGYYLCQAANNFGSLSALIKLTVNVGASFSSKYLMKYVKFNEKIELDCDPFGQSPVDIVWLVRQPSSSDLSSSSVANQAAAVSQLNHNNATFQASPASLQNLAMSNQSSSAPTSNPESLGRRLYIGTIRTELSQNSRQSDPSAASSGATASKSPSLPTDNQLSSGEAFFGRQLPPADHLEPFASFEILKRPGDGSEFVRLYIRQARRAHSADLICQARNRYGVDEKLIKLLVQEAPDPVREITAVQVDSRAAVLTWLAPYNGNSPITSYTVEWAQVAAQNQQQQHQLTGKWSHMTTQQPSTTITSLASMTSYEIRIRARNQFGQSAFATSVGSSPFIITTAEEAPAAPPSDLRAIPLSSSSIQLSWTAPGDSTMNNELRAATAIRSTGGGSNQPSYSIRGYYLGYKATNTNDSFIFKTVSLLDSGSETSDDSDHLLATPETASNETSIDQRPSMKNSPISTGRRLKVIIDNLRRSTKYVIIVQAFNSAGPGPQSDQIESKTLANDPPPAPLLRVGLLTYSSIELQWSFQTTPSGGSELSSLHGAQGKLETIGANESAKPLDTSSEKDISAVDGYNVYYRALEGQWAEQKLTPETHAIIASGHQRNDLSIVELSSEKVSTTTSPVETSKQSLHGWHRDSSHLASKSFRFILDQLACGNSYQIYLVAYNSIGSGLPSQIIRAKTRGSAPIAPRRQDYISVNSTYVQLNFEAWMDGGCSITNFEIKYKPLSRSGTVSSQSATESASGGGSNNIGQNQWLLLSSNVSPEQRLIELRDLQPETWYAVLTKAESAAGKTEVQYSFMTLNKWGQLPAEAMEANNLPALFGQSNASIRSILYNFVPAGHMSALTMSACMCLVLFATCLLFALRRYGGQLKDSASLDSQASTSGSGSQYQHHHHHHHTNPHKGSNHLNGRHRQQADYEQQVIGGGMAMKLGEEQPMIYRASNEQTAELYSLKGSPCKTTTGGTMLTATDGSSSGNCEGVGLLNTTQCSNGPDVSSAMPELSVDLNQFMNPSRLVQGDHHQCAHPPTQFQSSTLGHSSQHRDGYRCSSGCAESSIVSPGRAIIGALMREDFTADHPNRFKTIACRPLSSFATNSNIQNNLVPTGRFIYNGNGQPEQQLNLQDYQHHLNDQQQIYSKLRLIYNTHSNYNLCGLEEGPKSSQTLLETNDQICNGDTMNLAVLAQEQNQQKLLSRTLMRGNHQQQKNIYVHNGEYIEQVGLDGNSVDLSSLNCQQQPDTNNNKSNYGQFQVNQQIADPNSCGNNGLNISNGYNAGYCAPSVASGSTSTNTSSSQPTSSNSISHNSNNADQQANLISLANGDNGAINLSIAAGAPCQKASKVCPPSQLQQSISAAQPGPQNNEPNDYAQPFPPKWV